MHSILLINDSEHSALKKSQRIIAKYLPQVGPTTYLGALSAEGLQDLQNALTAASSRYLSVACYRIQHNLPPELAWVTGSKKNFDEELGLYAHRRSHVGPANTHVADTYWSKLLKLTLQAAALTHDIGKMSDAFQHKLWGACKGGASAGPRGEFLRHDAGSYLVLAALGFSLSQFRSLPTLDSGQLAALVRQPSAAALKDSFGATLAQELRALQTVLAPSGSRRRVVTPMPAEALICRLIAFLSLTHHRLPGLGKNDSYGSTYSDSLSADTYFNSAQAGAYATCLQYSGGNVFHDDAALGAQYLSVLDDLAEHLAHLPDDFDAGAFVRLTLHHGRPIFVQADYLASGMKSGEPVATGAVLGNTNRPANDALPSTPGDTLVTHIQSVYRHARRQAQFAHALVSNKTDDFPQLSSTAARSIDAKRSPVGLFSWQTHAYTLLKEGANGLPTFVAVTAGTGSGKTISSAQIMRALGSTRWTYALGLRSLTLQTGNSYQEDLGLTDKDLAVVIGDVVAKKAFSAEKFSAEQCGSESGEQDEDSIVVSKPQPSEWLKIMADKHRPVDVARAFSQRKVDFVSAPVVVCTVDQLMGVTKMTSVTKAFDYKRLQSADLVLDEVDNYSEAELKHISRLCFLVGLSRKNLVCLSATMGRVHAESLLEAYREGLKLNALLTGLGADLCLATVSNVCAPVLMKLEASGPLQPALAHIDSFNLATIYAGAGMPPNVRHRVLACGATEYGPITREALRLHRLNSAAVPELGGASVSAGFIRMNTVKSARKLAQHLYSTTDLPEDTEISVLCYHAKYSGLELSVIDRALNTVTNRKKLAPGQAFSAKAIEDYLKPLHAASGKKNLVVIVVTTSIIETGRDHDYDWAILEPSSTRSLIQAAGRVRRHRGEGSGEFNLSLVAYPERAFKDGAHSPKPPVDVFCFPGPLTPFKQKVYEGTDVPYPVLLARAIADLKIECGPAADVVRDSSAHGLLAEDAFADGVRNTIAVMPPEKLKNGLAILSTYALFKALLEPAHSNAQSLKQSSVSARAQRDEGLFLSSWAYAESFRGSGGWDEDRVFILSIRNLEAKRYDVCAPLNVGGRAAAVELDSVELASDARSLLCAVAGTAGKLEPVLEAEARRLVKAGFSNWDLMHFSGYTPERYGDKVPKSSYHPLLGYTLI